MSNAAKSIVVYGVYLIVALALPFLLIPDPLLALVGMHTPTDVWVRVLGMSVLLFGIYYIQAGRHELTPFFRWTIYGRYAVPFFFTAFVLLGYAPPILIAFAIPDVLFTTWTLLALRSADQAAVMPAAARRTS
ncbi:MAG: hypothetical protein ABI847_10125 [Anaerolineales bacterium]